MENNVKEYIDKNIGKYGRLFLEHENFELQPFEFAPGKYRKDKFLDPKKGKVVFLDNSAGWIFLNIHPSDDTQKIQIFESADDNISNCVTIGFEFLNKFLQRSVNPEISITNNEIRVGCCNTLAHYAYIYFDEKCNLIFKDCIGEMLEPLVIDDNTIDQLINRIHGLYEKMLDLLQCKDIEKAEEAFKSIEDILRLAINNIFIAPLQTKMAEEITIKNYLIEQLDKGYQDYLRAYCDKRAELLGGISRSESVSNRFTRK